jgi:hypothetical protein
VLSKPPDPEKADRPDELSAALRQGLPLVFWSRRTTRGHELYEFVSRLAEQGDFQGLPDRMRQARIAALDGSSHDRNPVEDLVLLWDDPQRLIPVELAPPPTLGDRDPGASDSVSA